jgi:salicylate hydroxylase
MHRADLAATLHNACQKSANIDIRFGIDTFSVANFGDQQTISFTPHQGEPDICQVRAFVGADGVSSPTRTEVLDGPQADYSGYVAWRALIDIDVAGKFLDLKKTSLMWGPRFHAVSYPLPHRNKVNLALFTKEALSVAFGIRGEPHLPVSVQSDTRLSAIMNAVDNWTHWPLASVMTGTWHKGAVGLIGDAAHAMLPFQAQGAAMAIEDAITLAKLLVNVAQPEAAFSQFESKRRSRVERVIETSKKNGNIFHMRRPATFARNLVVKMQGNTGHLDRLSWLYGHDPTA